MKRAILYMRVSTVDQHPESQLHDLRELAVRKTNSPRSPCTAHYRSTRLAAYY
jgi:DNA invertase Pin-like site-specific DNA recombinase